VLAKGGNPHLTYPLRLYRQIEMYQVPVQAHRNAVILAKDPECFHLDHTFPWDGMLETVAGAMPTGIDPDTGENVPFTFLATAGPPPEQGGPVLIERGGDSLINIGRRTQKEWYHQFSL